MAAKGARHPSPSGRHGTGCNGTNSALPPPTENLVEFLEAMAAFLCFARSLFPVVDARQNRLYDMRRNRIASPPDGFIVFDSRSNELRRWLGPLTHEDQDF
jgi:hypothetical protein